MSAKDWGYALHRVCRAIRQVVSQHLTSYMKRSAVFSCCKPCLLRLHSAWYDSSVLSVHQRMAFRRRMPQTRGKGKTLDADPRIAELRGNSE